MAHNIDPNKYSKNKDIKPESTLSSIVAVARIGIMLVGITGLAMELFRDDGWLKNVFSKLFESTTNMMLIPVIIFVLWLLNRWLTSTNKPETSKSGDLPMYAMMAIGAYYSFKLLTTGAF